jgi:hypothetical protein
MNLPKQNVQADKKHKAFDKRKAILSDGFLYDITIPWETTENDRWVSWNELCADIMEVFGLPGHRYMTHTTPACMKFYFKSEKDALLCNVLISDKI